jgi:hypothetical protein
MSKDKEKPGALHSFFGGLMLTIILVVVIPVLSAIFIEPILDDMLGGMEIGPLSASMLLTAAMLLVFILFILLLGGGKIFKKYGVFGVVGLIAAYVYLERPMDAILPVAIILIMVAFAWYKDSKKN